MKARYAFLGSLLAALAVCPLSGQTPLLGNIQAPYANLQSTVHIAGASYWPGAVAYGPVGTPLILTGSDLGGSGTVQFIPYVNGSPQTPVTATATMWTTTMVFVPVPSGATSGLVTVTVQGKQSNGLPFLVTPGIYSGSCPAYPPSNQLQITTSGLDDGMVGEAYSATVQATGGTTAYTWAILNNSLPAGLTLNASTGEISGTPTSAVGTVSVTVQVTDSSSPQQSTSATLDLTVTGSSQPTVVYSYCIAASPGPTCPSPASGGYDPVGNVVSYYDSVTGTWSMTNGYDTLNRLVGAQATAGPYYVSGGGLDATWNYDSFGNRTGGGVQQRAQHRPAPSRPQHRHLHRQQSDTDCGCRAAARAYL